MQVFKFGGASIRNAKAIINMADIIVKYGNKPLVIVVSAMGKTTRALEDYIEARVADGNGQEQLDLIKNYHAEILSELFSQPDQVYEEVDTMLNELSEIPHHNLSFSKFYDLVVSTGEMISSTIITAYLKDIKVRAIKINAPSVIRCSGNHQAGRVSWPLTTSKIKEEVLPLLEDTIVVTQGFIGSSESNDVITLGKEGSDYTAAIFASCLGADKVTIWKDVPGILSADPKLIEDTKQIMQLPYTEASEMTYYGASVIHPKTIKPLANKNIPLIVRSFDDPELKPTEILGVNVELLEPSIILKKNQCLFTFRVRDYTFVDEKSLARIFRTLDQFDININMMQSSAITISLCFDYKKSYIDLLFEHLAGKFSMQYLTGLELITLKNYTQAYLSKYRPNKEIILEQRSRRNCRFLVKPE